MFNNRTTTIATQNMNPYDLQWTPVSEHSLKSAQVLCRTRRPYFPPWDTHLAAAHSPFNAHFQSLKKEYGVKNHMQLWEWVGTTWVNLCYSNKVKPIYIEQGDIKLYLISNFPKITIYIKLPLAYYAISELSRSQWSRFYPVGRPISFSHWIHTG